MLNFTYVVLLPSTVLRLMLDRSRESCLECRARSGLKGAGGLCSRCYTREYISLLEYVIEQRKGRGVK